MLNYKFDKSELKIFLLILFISFFIRFPYFFSDLIDGDEITFAIMGNWVMDGNLPYDGLTDFKTPLTFYLYGIFMKIFDGDIFSLRVIGTFFLGSTSFIIYLICKKIISINTILPSIFFFIVFKFFLF